jgi:CheY-like chemotaxis protein
VEVRLERTDSLVTIKVSDTGPGIEPEFLPYVFDRFRQADATTKRQHRGLGLGLAIVRELVELHGGTVLAQSRGAARGSTFTIKLPLFIPRDEEPRMPNSSSSHRGISDRRLNGVRVLVVDDDADTRQVISMMLQHSGAETNVATSVKDALDIIASWMPHVVISDIAMPREDGYVLIRNLRSRPLEEGGNIPAVAITAYARAEDRARILSAGYQMHVAKPVEPDTLVAAVASLAGPRK